MDFDKTQTRRIQITSFSLCSDHFTMLTIYETGNRESFCSKTNKQTNDQTTCCVALQLYIIKLMRQYILKCFQIYSMKFNNVSYGTAPFHTIVISDPDSYKLTDKSKWQTLNPQKLGVRQFLLNKNTFSQYGHVRVVDEKPGATRDIPLVKETLYFVAQRFRRRQLSQCKQAGH